MSKIQLKRLVGEFTGVEETRLEILKSQQLLFAARTQIRVLLQAIKNREMERAPNTEALLMRPSLPPKAALWLNLNLK
ncbi:hypothetical protein BDFG_08164 [Blastomyces dermatitidis ATCC 26199]|nr:hypothetical protein BDFG_08164 [Blastomyces dermatitidis ATCC 26199]